MPTFPVPQDHNMPPHRLLAPIRSKRTTCAPAGDDDRAPQEAQTCCGPLCMSVLCRRSKQGIRGASRKAFAPYSAISDTAALKAATFEGPWRMPCS